MDMRFASFDRATRVDAPLPDHATFAAILAVAQANGRTARAARAIAHPAPAPAPTLLAPFAGDTAQPASGCFHARVAASLDRKGI